MATPSTKIFQFKISLLETKPLIWRRIQLPSNLNFEDLHKAIRDAMGWNSSHLHLFYASKGKPKRNFVIGSSSADWDDDNIMPEKITNITKFFTKVCDEVIYEYDLGDSWRHKIRLEKILPSEPGTFYPKCISGKRACPPVDVGGVEGFNGLLNILSHPEHEEYESYYRWLHDYMGYNEYNVEMFDPNEVKFEAKYIID
ncbi:hypothetical protein WA026_013413 [Henosepilachna vigintioctopunctata]|uniref:Plasmid pRiA4b Orf3-like domain-containing protein n=1 Tax=Henosepilachna vigintioctopunctata TaxID=420089 RepID=A0AAW1VG56_9CUCU